MSSYAKWLAGLSEARLAEHKKQASERAKTWYAKNKGEIRKRQEEARVKAYRENPKAKWLATALNSAKTRAKKEGRTYTLAGNELECPDFCPLLGIPLLYTIGRGANNREHSPSIDRIDTAKGYDPGNVWVVSWRANHIKSDASLEEFRAILKAWEKKCEF